MNRTKDIVSRKALHNSSFRAKRSIDPESRIFIMKLLDSGLRRNDDIASRVGEYLVPMGH